MNIIKFKTLPGLALGVYRSSYLPENPNHMIINDKIKKDQLFIDNDILNITDLGNGIELYSYISNKDNS